MNRIIQVGITLLIFFCADASAATYACTMFGKTFTVTLGNASDLGFTAISTDCQRLIDNHWSGFGMEEQYWDEGWGYENACDPMTPLNRTLRALELLKISRNDNLGGAFLNTAYDSTRSYIERLRTQCALNAANSAGAYHEKGDWAWVGGDAGSGVVYLYLTIFSDNVVGLAGSLVHEGRHKMKRHDGGTNCPRKVSCDSTWGFGGANQWEVNYLWWYGTHGTNSQRFMRQFALDRARVVHDRAFVTHPGFSIPKLAR